MNSTTLPHQTTQIDFSKDLSALPLVALVGSPNSGKSSLFNALTGSHQKTGNFPGVTVEKKTGHVFGKLPFNLIDLPGTYSFDTRTLDEKVARDVVLGLEAVKRPNLLIVVVDSSTLERSLYLAFELKRLNIPMIVVLNLFDLATKREQKIDLQRFEKELGIPVIPTVATQKVGLNELTQKIEDVLSQNKIPGNLDPNFLKEIKKVENVKSTFQQIDSLLKHTILHPIKSDSTTEKIDQWVLHPFWGPTILIGVLFLMFQALFSWSGPFADFIEEGLALFGTWVGNQMDEGHLRSLVVEGIIGGVGGVLVFLPQILILFALILFLEDIGYMGRAAFMLDHLMRRLGLPGKAVVPLLSSHACAIPGIMATRTLSEENDRLVTMLVSPLTTCSARLPVYALLIAAIVPAHKVIGPFSLQGIILFALYFAGIASAFIMAAIFKKTFFVGSISRLLMELPPYRFPSFRHLLQGLWQRATIFLKRAGTIILGLSIVIWFLVTFPQAPEEAAEPAINYSYAAKIGNALSPIFKPLGFDWKISTSLIPSLGAREVVVSSLATIFSVESEDEEVTQNNLTEIMAQRYSLATLLSLMVWFIFAPQCISTFAIFKKESGGWKWPTIMVIYTLFLSYFFSFLTYQLISGPLSS